ncbi:beta-1,3-galactosyl-O-glycosyl-glycoprotein beta-1,6-N-acetylglucosaminyltransferase-like [Petromyzon marinus]|uniref:beta-1,3-galactosyl-O-glycosyl-glycoprotein beta-1,6-N-acetylglucosaminyltransferase-like n=1 Tax=Petromyzon marinus TaxID=7757 RepID=UPI003F71EE8B
MAPRIPSSSSPSSSASPSRLHRQFRWCRHRLLYTRASSLLLLIAFLLLSLFYLLASRDGPWDPHAGRRHHGGPYAGTEAPRGAPAGGLPDLREEDPALRLPCAAIVSGDETAVEEAKRLERTAGYRTALLASQARQGAALSRLQEELSAALRAGTDTAPACERFVRARRYAGAGSASAEERDFPLAFSVVVHEDPAAVERLLRLLYLPHNRYCVHVDAKAEEAVYSTVEALSRCLPALRAAPRRVRVTYTAWSRVEADRACMEALDADPTPWKYLINLCGQDLPLKTNLEMVRALRALRGRNSLESERVPPQKQRRWRYRHVEGLVRGAPRMVPTNVTKEPPAGPVFSGSAYFAGTRAFVRFALRAPAALALSSWLSDAYSPDEQLWATLHRLPGAPGGVPAHPKYDVSDMNALARLVKWRYLEGDESMGAAAYPPCRGRHRRSVCVLGAGDLAWALRQPHLFANKLDSRVEPAAVQCLEEHVRGTAIRQRELD